MGDLGACCLRDPYGKGHFAGTARTMAPEVAHIGHTTAPGDWHLHLPTSVGSDVYSLGASLYWLLSGQAGFSTAVAARQALSGVVGLKGRALLTIAADASECDQGARC